MRISIRSKLIFAISLLMVIVFSFAAYLFINEKKVEMANDIYVRMQAFSRLTAPTIAYNYDLYLAQNSFVYFNREIQNVFSQNEDLAAIKIISYNGELLYDSETDVAKKYEGEPRIVDEQFLAEIRSENMAVRTIEGRSVYIQRDVQGNITYVDKNEIPVEPLKSGVMLDHLIMPASQKYSVVYDISYDNLNKRVTEMMMRIIYLAVFAIMLGMMLSFLMSSQIVRPVKKLEAGAAEVAKGNFKARVDIRTRDEMEYLGHAFNKMTEDLEKSIEARLYQERVTQELKIASDIQKEIIPDKVPQVNGLDIAAGIIPAEEIGGDMYDFLPVGSDRLLMYLGDVTGHGVPAGIVSSIANALFYGYSTEPDLKKMVIDVNRVLYAKTMTNMFMTLCLMEWNIKEQKFSFVNAGHERIMHYKAQEQKIEFSSTKGIALGMVKDVENNLEQGEILFEKGDFLIIYSDGIPEAFNDKKECYCMDRFSAAVQRFGTLPTSEEMKKAILEDVKQFVSGHEQTDDITLIVLKRI